jgi:hypothetical protein
MMSALNCASMVVNDPTSMGGSGPASMGGSDFTSMVAANGPTAASVPTSMIPGNGVVEWI